MEINLVLLQANTMLATWSQLIEHTNLQIIDNIIKFTNIYTSTIMRVEIIYAYGLPYIYRYIHKVNRIYSILEKWLIVVISLSPVISFSMKTLEK